MNRASVKWLSFLVWLFSSLYLAAAGELSTNGAFSCEGVQGQPIIQVNNFTFLYGEGDNSVTYTVEATSQAQVNVTGK
jgi:hypothetical protein